MSANDDARTLRDDVAISQIFMDDTYGREPIPAHVRQLADHWDRSAAGVLYLSLRNDGRFACLDGWNRVNACKEAEGPNATLPALVYIDLTVQQEAALFNKFNRDRKPLSQLQLWKSRIAEREPIPMDIRAIVASVGWRVGKRDRDSANGVIGAVSELEAAYRRVGHTMFREMMSVIAEAMSDSGTCPGQVMHGLSQMYVRFGGEIERARLVRVLVAHGPHKLVQKGRELHLSMGVADGMGVGMFLWERYNAGRGVKLGPWQAMAMGQEARENWQTPARMEAAKTIGASNRLLTAEQVREIRALLALHQYTNVAIAQRYGVSSSTIGDIGRGKSYQDVA